LVCYCSAIESIDSCGPFHLTLLLATYMTSHWEVLLTIDIVASVVQTIVREGREMGLRLNSIKMNRPP